MSRLRRKNEHIFQCLKNAPVRADFSGLHFIHNCLPGLDADEVKLETTYLGRTHRSPLFINALTGGTKLAYRINASLAEAARYCGLPMAVGSQMAAIEKGALEESFKVVRRVNPDGTIWANIGSYAGPDEARRAVEMIGADALQIHLNVPQELAMQEGDRRFKGMSGRIAAICREVGVPVILKEVGFGIGRDQAEAAVGAGISAIDVGGKGGTNFLAVERERSGYKWSEDFIGWGIPTAISLVECIESAKGKIPVFASGGLHKAVDIALALALGADAAGMAAWPLYVLLKKGRRALIREIKAIERELRLIMLMAGASGIAQLQQAPLVITGFTAEWMLRRKIDPGRYANRKISVDG